MLLRASPAFSLLNSHSENLSPFLSSARAGNGNGNGNGLVVCAAKGSNNKPLTGVIFEPFEEVKKELMLVPTVPQVSIARQKYTDECEAAINEQINVEYNVSYVYHALYAYFDRDNVALKGLAKFFKESSEEERDHAEKLMEYQNKRGGKVKLQSILMPQSEFDHAEKGDALHAMELALSLEKLTNEKLLNLHAVASQNNDVQLADFVESEFLGEQVEAIKKISDYVAQLRRIGKGHGVWHFDQMLLHEEEAVA
ncbi:Ferroxidase [Bertholletia excelsa]